MCLSIPVDNKAGEASEKKVERYAMATSGWMCKNTIRCVNECPTMHYLGIPRHTLLMKAYKIFSEILHCGNVVNMPYCEMMMLRKRLFYKLAEFNMNFAAQNPLVSYELQMYVNLSFDSI